MVRFRRLVVPGYPHHVTQRGVRRQTTFFEPQDYKAYLELAEGLLEESALDVHSYCLMPNHIHAVVVPHDKEVLSRFFAKLHRRYARRTNKLYGWQGHLWQERFFSVAMDHSHTMSVMRYVELNPVRAGMVRRAQDWQWSSARGNMELADDPLVDRAKTRKIVSHWAEYLGEELDERELDQVRVQTRIGRPEGDEGFIDRVEALTGRPLRKKKRGPKPKKVTGT
jgi:putative transposase